MKKINYFFSLVLTILFAGSFVACQSDETLTDFFEKRGGLTRTAKAPDLVLYSGEATLSSTFATRAMTRAETGTYAYYKVQDGIDKLPEAFRANVPATITSEEKTFVLNYLREHPNEGSTESNLTNYFIQNIGSGYATYSVRDHNNATHNITGGNHMDYLVINGQHINDYNAHWGPDALITNLSLTNPTYHDSWGDKNNTKAGAYRFYYIEYNGVMGYYLCFDYKTEKNSGELHVGDGIYNDWVVKITPAAGGAIVSPTPVPPVVVDEDLTINKSEVEVNLSVNDKKAEGDYIATKLSVHVRALTDVEVFIPVAARYYCDVDDMNIVYSHKLDPNYDYYKVAEKETGTEAGGEVYSQYTYNQIVSGSYTNAEGTKVDVNETVLVTIKYEVGGIRMKTEGVNQKILDYLQATYHDGITFEVWNYYNSEYRDADRQKVSVTREDLKPMFDNATIKFSEPANVDQYVNAFAMLYGYQREDIHVYFKEDGKPYKTDRQYTYDSTTGKVLSVTETKTDNLLEQKYWEANEDGTFKKFVGEKNAWDCAVTPIAKDANDPTRWDNTKTNDGVAPKNFNKFYTK